MTAIREIQFTGTLKNKWPDVKEFIFNDVLKDIDLSDIDKISVHEITSDVVCNGKCFKPKKGSGRGYKLSISINLKRPLIIIYDVRDTEELFLFILCHELFHYLFHSLKIEIIDSGYIIDSEINANWFASQQIEKWREKK
jgi:Zn-dependent peptidase ImmA (M78 family)